MTKEKPLYRQILREALTIIWRNKFLWFFGLFAAMAGSVEYNFLIEGFSRSSGDKPLTLGFLDVARDVANTGIFRFETLGNLKRIMIENPFSFFMSVFIFLVFLGIAAFVIWLIVVSQASLISATRKIEQGEIADLREEMEKNRRSFWPLFFLNFINKFLTGLLLVLVGVVVFVSAIKATVMTLLLFILAFIIFISLSLIIAFITKYAICFVVLKKQVWFESIKSAVNLFFANWVISLEMALILFAIDFVFILFFAISTLVLMLAVAMLIILAAFLSLKMTFWGVVILPVFLLIILFLIITSGLTAFQYSSWTLLFMRLAGKKTVVSKLARLASNLSNKVMGG